MYISGPIPMVNYVYTILSLTSFGTDNEPFVRVITQGSVLRPMYFLNPYQFILYLRIDKLYWSTMNNSNVYTEMDTIYQIYIPKPYIYRISY